MDSLLRDQTQKPKELNATTPLPIANGESVRFHEKARRAIRAFIFTQFLS